LPGTQAGLEVVAYLAMAETDPSSAPATNGDEALDDSRREIDTIDAQLASLMQQRARLAQRIGEWKRAHDQPIYDPSREAAIEARLAATAGPLDTDALVSVFKTLIKACRNLEAPSTVAFLGPQGTFSQLAAQHAAGGGAELMPCDGLGEAVDCVTRGRAELAVLPVENSTEGTVGETFDLLDAHPLYIRHEVVVPIRLSLIGPPRLEDVEVVYSHPQPLAQARDWLRRNLPGVQTVAAGSTADAARHVDGRTGAAALVGPLAVQQTHAHVLAERVEDRPDNRTRFWVVGREPVCGGDRSSIVMTLAHRPGSLAQALGLLAEHGINLTSIVSRPAVGQPWQYRFFFDVEGDVERGPGAAALEALGQAGAHLRVLGVYRREEVSA